MTYSIDNGRGEQLTTGLSSESEAIASAQHQANKLGEPVYWYHDGKGAVSHEVAPETICLVTLDDVSPSRATVSAVAQVAYRSPITARNYAIVTDPELVPEVGERVWIDDGATRSSGQRRITARA